MPIKFIDAVKDLNPYEPQNLAGLSLCDEGDAGFLLWAEKHALLQGLVAEDLCERELIRPMFRASDISSGWWMGIARVPAAGGGYDRMYHLAKLTIGNEQLTPLDYRIIRRFLDWNFMVSHYRFDCKEDAFDQAKASKRNGRIAFGPWEPVPFLDNARFKLPPESDRDPERIVAALRYFRERRQLTEIAVNRLFVNGVFDVRWPVNLDRFLAWGSGLLLVETKHKSLVRDQSGFGINDIECKYLRYLQNLGINVVHVILTKPFKDVCGTDLLKQEWAARDSAWIAVRGTFLPDRSVLRSAPEDTSISGSHEMTFRPLPLENFRWLKSFGQDRPRALEMFMCNQCDGVSAADILPQQQAC